MSPLLGPHSVNSDLPIQDYRRSNSNTACHLETDIEEDLLGSDAAEYNIVSPGVSQDSWEEIPTSSQLYFDIESINHDESDQDDEAYYESY
jgi:hypothetical protein